MTTFKMMQEPKAPTRRHFHRLLFHVEMANDQYSLQAILSHLKKKKISPECCMLRPDISGYMYVYRHDLESNDAFNKRYAKYQEKLDAYKIWLPQYQDHMQTIQHRKEVKEFAKRQKEKARLVRHKEEIEKQIQKLEAQGI